MKKIERTTCPIDKINKAPYNPRTISKAAKDGLRKSIERWGLVQDIVVNRRNMRVIGGHQRLAVLHDQGVKEVPVTFVDLDQTEEKALNVAMNSPTIQGSFTDELQGMLEEIEQATPDAFLDLKLDDLMEDDANDKKDLDDIPPEGKTIARPGDLWSLGNHLLLCGSCTEQKNVARLIGHGQASCIFTDPPYGVSYEAKSGKHAIIKGDDLRDDGLVKLLAPAFRLAVKVSRDNAAFYIWHASSTREDFAFAMRAAGLVERQYLIWVKNAFAVGYSDYRWSHEPCFYASRAEQKPTFYGDAAESTVWRVSTTKRGAVATVVGNGLLIQDGKGNKLWIQTKAPAHKKVRTARLDGDDALALSAIDSSGTVWEVSRDTAPEHPTQKPVELALRALRNSTQEGETVYDPFLGSGSTLIAAEVSGRRCVGCELDPKYASLIIRRWEAFTGHKATKL